MTETEETNTEEVEEEEYENEKEDFMGLNKINIPNKIDVLTPTI